MAGTRRRKREKKNEALSVEEYLKKIPAPPKEHEHELKMEKLLKRMLEQAEKLSEDELRFYSRQIMLNEVGPEGQLRLKKARVCLVGLGGLGSTIATQLAAMGTGHLRFIDRDIVEESNLQRQHLYSFDVIGYPKVEAAVKRLERLNPYIEFEPLPVSFSENNAEEMVSGMDVVVDGLDNMNTRYAINRACVKLGIPYVFGSAVSTFGNASTIVPRKTACLECFYGKLDDSLLPTCGMIGVHPSVIGIVASVEVVETIKILLGKQPTLANKLLYCDVDSMRFEEIKVVRAETCPVCGNHPKNKPKPLKHALIEEECGRNKKRVFTVTPLENLDLDIEKMAAFLKKEGVQLKVKTRLGVAFTPKEGILASLLNSGVMVVEGASGEEETLRIYKDIVMHKMRIPWSRVMR
jgi:molybdopterin/thiamine biosynthesis adenylyltransferase